MFGRFVEQVVQTPWIAAIIAALLGLGLGVAVLGALWYMLSDEDSENDPLVGFSDDHLTDQLELVKSMRSNVCSICEVESKEPLPYGGCVDYPVCNACYRSYNPLPFRCPLCGQYMCYRRGRAAATTQNLPDADKDSGLSNQHTSTDGDHGGLRSRIRGAGRRKGKEGDDY